MRTAKVSPVLAVETSDNAKLGACSATYVSQASCPDCVFRENGCYAEYGPMGHWTRRLSDSPESNPTRLAREEAGAIDRLTGDRPLRLHVVGDCRTPRAARVVSEACQRYTARGGRKVWTYTHGWRGVPRHNWGHVSVLASCETPGQAMDAMLLDYAAAVVVPRFESQRRYWYGVPGSGGVFVIPCPYQTRGVQCRDCRLCWDDARLLDRRLVIGFEAHGAGAARVRRSLPVVA